MRLFYERKDLVMKTLVMNRISQRRISSQSQSRCWSICNANLNSEIHNEK